MYLQNNHCISIGKFTESFCKTIVNFAEKQKLENAKIQDGNSNNRSSKITWLKNNLDIDKILIPIIEEHNKKANWNFALHDLEPLQYTIYEINDHYDWHIDSHAKPYNNGLIRKISFTLCLNEDYEGGEFEVSNPNPNPEKHINTKFNDTFTVGTFISFPSFVWHKVHPVTKGTRKVLVGWSLGPQFI